jgi:hypothetical protein
LDVLIDRLSRLWVVRGTFRYRAQHIAAAAAARIAATNEPKKVVPYHPHPHPQFQFTALPPSMHDGTWTRGLRHRTVMVTNVPLGLRSERELHDYFDYYLARPVAIPALGLPPSVAPGLLNKIATYLWNRARRTTDRFGRGSREGRRSKDVEATAPSHKESEIYEHPQIDRVVVVRKMTELASLLHRREDVLVKLETAHIQLARRALDAVRNHRDPRPSTDIFLRSLRTSVPHIHVEEASGFDEAAAKHGEGRMDLLVRVLSPFVNQEIPDTTLLQHPLLQKNGAGSDSDTGHGDEPRTVWDALLSLPRSTLDSFQPLIRLGRVWRGNTVPAIDYYTAKLNVLNSLILELRAADAAHVPPASTAFVTFKEPEGARRACRFLAAHPSNPLSCLVRMAPAAEDLDWGRLMKTAYRAEVIKDWVVGIGVWGFTIFWLVPVSALLSLVDLQNFESIWPAAVRVRFACEHRVC